MFDLGDLGMLSARELLKVSHVFVTHTHMDHFIGFDTLLRILLGRNKTLHLFGPPDFHRHVEGKLAGYTWNLVNEFENEFTLAVNEVHPDIILKKTYACQERFLNKAAATSIPFSGELLKEPSFSVQCLLLNHRTPCLGLSLKENFFINIIKEKLKELGLPVGPWLNRFKSAVYQREDFGDDFLVTWKEAGEVTHEKRFLLGDLAEKIARITPGQKIVYITDVVADPENCRQIIELAQGADLLFIEAPFLDKEKETAWKKYHLTAREAGKLAKKAGVKEFRLFHFSPRYKGHAQELEKEAKQAWQDFEPATRNP